ncbi:hypothetical protein CFI10_11160 [Marinobacterium iners]|uniref:hypothetical protein n=1 Tax=Marinobacterium iners TaxID=48076 RepID=UPI001A8FE62B|nr:hypothetical protein [Marinobacterium iners]QSR35546.1 hypothetical protein CFI10_11160 [Marinobacterium iners]
MASNFKLYEDAAGTVPQGATKGLTHNANLGDNPKDFIVYLMNKDDDPLDAGSLTMFDQANPGVDPIMIYAEDVAPGAGHEVTEITLALSAAELGTNNPGDPLALGTQILSGVSNAVAIHVRIVNAVTTVSISDELEIWLSPTVETASA